MHIEVVTFRATSNDRDAVRAAIAESSRFLSVQRGFIERAAGVSPAGEWVDIVYWESMEDANHAAELFPAAPECQTFIRLIAPETVRMAHYEATPNSRP